MIFTINILLIFSFIVFTIVRALLARISFVAPNRALLRYSQVLIVLSVLLPVVLHVLPDQKLPQIEMKVFTSIPEEIDHYSKKATNVLVPQQSTPIHPSKVERIYEVKEAVLLFFWVIGVLFFFIRLFLSLRKLNRVLDQGTVFKKIGSVNVLISESISIPFSTRFFNTKWVVIPLEMLNRSADFKLVVKHELQHHRQGDTLWAVWIEIIQNLLYFNPAIYGWKKTIVELQEFSCDEALTGQRSVSAHEYGSCLVRVAETALETREMYVGTTCMATVSKNPKAFKTLLRRRIEMIMQNKKSAKKLAGSFIGALTLMTTVAIAYSSEQASRKMVVVDSSIQKIADSVLKRAIENQGAKAGFAIVTDPYTGKILAVANIDKSNRRKGQWALTEEMEPASLMKGILAAEAIQQGVTTLDAQHGCEKGTYQYGERTFHDWKKGGWEKLSTAESVANSSDICSLKIAEKLGSNKLREMFIRYELGNPINISELAPAASYGMGFKTNALKLLQAYGAIANGGNLIDYKKSQITRRVLSEDSAKKMREVLKQVVTDGTAKRFPSKIYSMAGKTESSFSGGVIEGESTGGPQKTDVAGFIGFAPANQPRVQIYVAIFNPNDITGAHGSTHAVPVFSELTDEVLKHLKVLPDQQKI